MARAQLRTSGLASDHCKSDRQNSTVHNQCFQEQRLTPCDPLRLNSELEYSTRCHQLTSDEMRERPDLQAQTSPIKENQLKSTVDDDKEDKEVKAIFSSQDESMKVDKSQFHDETERDNRSIYQRDDIQRHLNQSKTITSKLCHLINDPCLHPRELHSLMHTNRRQTTKPRRLSVAANLPRNILTILFVNAILNHLTHIIHPGPTKGGPYHIQSFAYLNIVGAGK